MKLRQTRGQAPRDAPVVQRWGAPPRAGSASFFREHDGFLLRFHGVADFLLSDDGRQVACFPAEPAAAPWEPVYRQQVVPLQRAQQGEAVFHGGAVSVDGAAVALLGPSGRGKSTLTAACGSAGMPFLTDDCLILREGTSVQVEPGADHIRVWPDSYSHLDPGLRPSATDAGVKPELRADPERLPHAAEAARLACMLVLETSDGGIRLNRLSPADAALAWCANAFVVDQRSAAVLGTNLARAARLAQRVPAYRLAYPRDYACLPDVVAAVESCTRAAALANGA